MNENYSHSVPNLTLQILNDQETARRLIPIIYLSCLMIIGIPGNLLVIVVYSLTVKRRTTHRLFIIALAVSDFMVCTITVPFEIYQMTNQLTFSQEWACKVFRATNVFLAVVSSFILIALSADRMRRVMQPLRLQMTPRQASWSIVLVCVLALFFAWPEAVISGISLEKLDYNITGYDCSFSDRYKDEHYTTAYSSILLAIYIGCMICLIVMYSFIGKQVLSHVHFQGTFIRQNGGENYSIASSNKLDNNEIKNDQDYNCDSKSDEDDLNIRISEKKSKVKEKASQEATHTMERRTSPMRHSNSSKKVTKIAFAISFCFILSYLPFVAVKLNASIASGNFVSNDVTKAVFPILARTFIINNIVNPIIYGFLDKKFRQKCKILLSRLTCRS